MTNLVQKKFFIIEIHLHSLLFLSEAASLFTKKLFSAIK